MSADLVIVGGQVKVGDSFQGADLVIDGGIVTAVLPAGEAPAGKQRIDADGLHVIPGLVDSHVHFDDPGRAEWEGWATGSLAAAAGGITTVVDMPIDSDPPTTDRESFEAKLHSAAMSSVVDYALWAGLVPGNADELVKMAGLGAVGFKAFACDSGWDDFRPVAEEDLVIGLETGRSLGLVVALHAEDPAILEADPSGPDIAEVQSVRWSGRIASRLGARLHIVHASASSAVEEASRWQGVTTETCPHYLVLDDADVERIGPTSLVAPPIRSGANQEQLWRQLGSGLISSIVSDHSPCPPELKLRPEPFNGIGGIESGLSVLLGTGRLPLARLVDLMTAPAKLFALLRKGSIAVGFDADIVLFDPEEQWVLNGENLHSRHRISPYSGMKMAGRVKRTLVRGRTVYLEGELASEPWGIQVKPG